MVPLLGAIVGCHYSVLWFGGRVIRRLGEWTCHCRVPLKGCRCSVLWFGGRVTTNFGGVGVVPLLGAIVGCHCSVLWWGVGCQPCRSGRGAIAGCHRRVPL